MIAVDPLRKVSIAECVGFVGWKCRACKRDNCKARGTERKAEAERRGYMIIINTRKK